MSLVRKVRRVGSSLVITIPSHVAEAYGIDEGTMMDIRLGPNGDIVLKKRGD